MGEAGTYLDEIHNDFPGISLASYVCLDAAVDSAQAVAVLQAKVCPPLPGELAAGGHPLPPLILSQQ